MRRGRRLLLAVVLGVVPLAGCDGSAADRPGTLTPVSESLPPGASWQAGAAASAAPSRDVLAPEMPARTVLPGDPAPAPGAAGDGRERQWPEPREDRSDTSTRRVMPDRPAPPVPTARATTSAGDVRSEPSARPAKPASPAKPAAPDKPAKRVKKTKKPHDPAPVTEPASPGSSDPGAAPATPAEGAAARPENGSTGDVTCGVVRCR
ncbi:hypothetical protein GCM10023107_06520 [Actinoplanes octamycinicus]|nr:hypothetical protein Aoc01nite_08080 [Actinoplanes octamycinicus]